MILILLAYHPIASRHIAQTLVQRHCNNYHI